MFLEKCLLDKTIISIVFVSAKIKNEHVLNHLTATVKNTKKQ